MDVRSTGASTSPPIDVAIVVDEKSATSSTASPIDPAQVLDASATQSTSSLGVTQGPAELSKVVPDVPAPVETPRTVAGHPKEPDAPSMEPRPMHEDAARPTATPSEPTSSKDSEGKPSAQKTTTDKDSSGERKAARVLDAVLVPGAPSTAFDADESTSEMSPPSPPEPVVAGAPPKTTAADTFRSEPRPLSAVLVAGAPAMSFGEEEPTSEIIPPAPGDAAKDVSSAQARDEKSHAQPPASSHRRTTVLVPAAANPAFAEEESTSEMVLPPQAASRATPSTTRDSGRFPSVTPSGKGSDAASSVPSQEDGAELARSQREESQLIARRAWRELAQLYLKRADRAKDAPARAEALTRLAEVMENELQDSAGAARMYREIVELTGERTALREQVRLLSLREDASLVRRALDDAIKRARTSRARAIALLTRGERQLNMGAPAKAREDLEAAEALVPGLLPVLAGLVRCVSDEERPVHAERLRAACAAAPRRAPDRLDALRVLAQTAEESLGDLRVAQWAWAEVLAESPDSDQPREHLLALARRLGDLPALSQLLHAQLAREPRGPEARKAHLERVATLEAMGDAGAALAELRQAVRFEPGHKEAWLLLADRCTEREQMGEAAWAMENAATATEDDEERQRMWERLALFCREVLHNTERARTYARRAESLRKSREARVRPPEPPRPAPAPAPGVAPPSVLVSPPVPTGRVPVRNKDLSDEVTANTDLGSLGAVGEPSPATSEKPPVQQAKDGGARASTAAKPSSSKSGRGTPEAEETSRAAVAVKAPSGSHAPVASTSPGLESPRRAASVKAPSGSHASVKDAEPGARKSASVKAPPEGPPSLADAAPGPSTTARASSAKSARGSALDAVAPKREAAPEEGAATGRNPRAPAAPPRERTTAFGAPIASEPVPSPALVAPPTPSSISRKAAPATPAASREPPPKARASSSPRADSARPPPAPAASHPWDDEEEDATAAPSPVSPRSAPAEASAPSAQARSAAPEGTTNARPPRGPGADAASPGGTQVREAAPSVRPERAPRAGHAPRAPLSASGVEPPAASARAPLSASGVEPPSSPRAPAASSRPVPPPARPRGVFDAPPTGPTLDQIPDEDEDSEELGGGPVEATSVIAWEAPPGRMDPVRRIHRAGRPEGTMSGPAPVRATGPSRTTVGGAETRETPLVPDAAPPAEATSAEPIVFKLVRERPLDPKPYRGLVEHFDQRKDVTRAALMRELADALEGRDVSAPRVQRGPLTSQERAGLRHPGLRTPAGELLACVGIALCRLFPSPARIASTSEPLRATAGPGAPAILDALHTVARLLGVPLPELIAGDDDTANITPVHITVPRLVVGRQLVQQPPSVAELRFHAGRALFSMSPDLLALRALRKDHLLRALALLSSVLKDPRGAGDDARVVREALSPKALERASALMEPGTRDFDASLLSAAARDSANRAGLVACGGPGPALIALRARRPHDSELEELVRFAASERYLALRAPTEAGRAGR
nr:hypothetical protein [Corallococcus soli]